MAYVNAIKLVLFLMAVLQPKNIAARQNGFILLSCLDTPAENSSVGPCLLRSHPPVRRDDYSYTPGIGGHKFHLRAVPWNEARLTCEDEGGHLAIINSIAEANVISEIFMKAPKIPNTKHPDYVNIGFHEHYNPGQYVTIHGQSLAKAGFTEWHPGQPDNYQVDENCGSVHKDGRLNDMDCKADCAFICELPIY